MAEEGTTRLIVKNLSRSCTPEDLKKAIPNMFVTDAKIVSTKSGNSRRFGFIGFKSVDDAKIAQKLIHNTYIGTSKVVAEFALPVGHQSIPSLVGTLSKLKQEQRSKKEAKSETNDTGVIDHGRVHVVNLPHACTREEISEYFAAIGPVREVHLLMDEDSGRPRGMGFVTYVFPRDGIKAIAELDYSIFQGRLLRVSGAKEKIVKKVEVKTERMTDFQKKRLDEKIAQASTAVHTWNLLYTSANAAAAAMADQIEGLDRSDILLGDSVQSDPAVRAAIAETEVIGQTREWLKNQGIDSRKFERTGNSVLTAHTDLPRSKDTIIIKHLPPNVELDSLRFMFSRNGETLTKFLLAPSKTLAIAQFADQGSAKRSFTANAFRKYKAVPLYLEWAPERVFYQEEPEAEVESVAKAVDTELVEEKTKIQSLPEETTTNRLCVRNVAFEATSKDIRKLFSAYARVVAVRLPSKVAAAGDASTGIRKQHRGFAFVEFTSRAEMAKAFESLQNTHLFGRKLVLEPAALEDGSVDAARLKAQRREELESGALATESKRRKIEETTLNDEDNAFDDMVI